MSANKRYRQGQILKLISAESIHNQDELRRGLAHLKLRVTQATLSRDLTELQIVKTAQGYKPLSTATPESATGSGSPLTHLARALREFLMDLRPAQNILVLKTPPGGAQPIAAALDGEKWIEVAGTIAGDDTILIVTPNVRTRALVQKRMEDLLK